MVAKPVLLRICLVFVILLALPIRTEAQIVEWMEQPFFIKGMAQYYLFPANAPFDFWSYLKPEPAFRAALGYEWRQFAFSLESGYTHFAGIDPYRMYVEDLHLLPLLFKFGYTFLLPKGFGIQPEVGAGAILYKVYHYPTEKDWLEGSLKETFAQNLIAALRLNLVWEIYRVPVLRLHIGGGVDMIPEAEGLFFIPAVEAGLTFKPRLPRRIPVRPVSQPMIPTLPTLQAALKNVKDIAIEEVPQGIKLTVWNIHFIDGKDQIVPADYPRLVTIANAIKQVPVSRKIQVEGHVAAEGRPGEEMDLSFWRGQVILEALSSQNIADKRIYFRPWGGLKPLMSNATAEGRYENNRAEITLLNEGEDWIQ
ncbi:hypothetical protein AGMMS49940_10090 [Spirochaetia bacterium]|nr:hypothetical protein AGMMS49940_09940 [Spirochaetia bacterium]GHV73707.1 hypothetical protein AGMMS49940_10090 [Spirochaetia bacterium]